MSRIIWALFGNDDGGIYGERDGAWVAAGNAERTPWTAIRWWLRNPFHNLFWHVLDWPSETALILFEAPPVAAFYRRPPRQWLTDGNHFQIALAPFFIGWRCGVWEGYCGWRDKDGRLGFAFRKTSK